MTVTSPGLMLNKTECQVLEIIQKVSCSASQQFSRGFHVIAKNHLRNAHRVHKEG